MIPEPETNGRLLVALDDFINPKTGKKIFGCASVFDHAAKQNQSKYPWAQNIVSIGLLKMIKGRWACLPLGHCESRDALKKLNNSLSIFQGEVFASGQILAPRHGVTDAGNTHGKGARQIGQ